MFPTATIFTRLTNIFRRGRAQDEKCKEYQPVPTSADANPRTPKSGQVPFDYRHTGRFENDFETRGIITRFSQTSAASGFAVQGHGHTSLSIERGIRSNAQEITMRSYDGNELIRLYPSQDRRRQILHMFDSRDLCYYTLYKSDTVLREGYQSVLVWKGEDGGIGQPIWAVHVKTSGNYAKVQEMASGRIMLVVDQRFARLRKWTSGHESKRLRIMARTDLAMMAMFAACLEYICDEAFGRNLSFAPDFGDRMIITERE